MMMKRMMKKTCVKKLTQVDVWLFTSAHSQVTSKGRVKILLDSSLIQA